MLGITGTGGSGKSSLTDELVRRFRLDQEDKLRIAVLAVDPTRRRGGGALLGDRIRMNAIDPPQVYFRSLATRSTAVRGARLRSPTSSRRASRRGADLVIVETPGIGQGDAAIVPYVDVSLYVMTPEFGAASQLEKIDMLDFADVVAINKFERRGAEDALRDVAPPAGPQPRGLRPDRPTTCRCSAPSPPASTTTASPRSTSTCAAELAAAGTGHRARLAAGGRHRDARRGLSEIVPPARARYLAEIAETVRGYHADHRASRPRSPAGASSSTPSASCSPARVTAPRTSSR